MGPAEQAYRVDTFQTDKIRFSRTSPAVIEFSTYLPTVEWWSRDLRKGSQDYWKSVGPICGIYSPIIINYKPKCRYAPLRLECLSCCMLHLSGDSEWQWHQLGYMQICTSPQTDNHANIPPLSFYRLDALPAAQPTASKHWRHPKDQVWNFKMKANFRPFLLIFIAACLKWQLLCTSNALKLHDNLVLHILI